MLLTRFLAAATVLLSTLASVLVDATYSLSSSQLRQRRLQTSVSSLQSLVSGLRRAIPDEEDPAFVRFYKRYCAPKGGVETAVEKKKSRRQNRPWKRHNAYQGYRVRRDVDNAAATADSFDSAALPGSPSGSAESAPGAAASMSATNALNLFPEDDAQAEREMGIGSALSLIGGELNTHSISIKRIRRALENLARELMQTTSSLGNTDEEFAKFAQQIQTLSEQHADRILDMGAQLQAISKDAMERDQMLEQMIYNLTDMTSNIRMIAQEQEEAIKNLRSQDSDIDESLDLLGMEDAKLHAADQSLKDGIAVLQFNISGLVLMAEIHGNDLLTQREEINLMKKTVEDHAQRIEDLEELEKLDRKLRQEQENRINQLLASTKGLADRMTASERNAAELAKNVGDLQATTAELTKTTQALKAADEELQGSLSSGSNNAAELLSLIRDQGRQIDELKEMNMKLQDDDNKLAAFLADSSNKTELLIGRLALQKQRLDGFKSDQVGLEGKLLDLGSTVSKHGGALEVHQGHIKNIKDTRDDDFEFLNNLHGGVKGHVNVSIDQLQKKLGNLNSAIDGLKRAVRKDCPEGFIPAPPGMFSCYKFVLVPNSHADARLECQEEGADLIAIESPDEHMFVTEYIKNRPELRTRSYWTSGTDQHEEAHWKWLSTDQPITGYTKWSPGEPNGARVENCIELRASFGFHWNDLICTNKLGAVCEYTYPARR